MQPTYGRIQAACRLHASVNGADSIGLQCIIVGIQGIDAVHAGGDALHATYITIVIYAVDEHVSSRRISLF